LPESASRTRGSGFLLKERDIYLGMKFKNVRLPDLTVVGSKDIIGGK
jgi:hypothetical protein